MRSFSLAAKAISDADKQTLYLAAQMGIYRIRLKHHGARAIFLTHLLIT
jgi:hypothetical protein